MTNLQSMNIFGCKHIYLSVDYFPDLYTVVVLKNYDLIKNIGLKKIFNFITNFSCI